MWNAANDNDKSSIYVPMWVIWGILGIMGIICVLLFAWIIWDTRSTVNYQGLKARASEKVKEW